MSSCYYNFKFEKLDISKSDPLIKVFKLFKPSKVVNLAAQAGVRYSIQNPYAYLDSNLSGFVNILEICRHEKIDGLIYASSSSVYGGNEKIPFSVEDRVDNPISLYAATKKANELIATTYSHLYGLHTTGLRFFTVYGPWGRPDMALFLFTKAILERKHIQVYNNGKMKRDFTYIDDLVQGVINILENKNSRNQIFNLTYGQSSSLDDMADILKRHFPDVKINYLPKDKLVPDRGTLSVEKAKELIGYAPQYPLGKGFVKYIEWYKELFK